MRHMKKVVEWIIRMLGYTLVLVIVSLIFKKTIYIDTAYYWIWGLLTVVIIFILNRTLKPILFWLTLPITGVTLGLFYPILNVLILKLTDLILFNHFEINGILFLLLVSIIISIMNALMDHFIINKLTKGALKWILLHFLLVLLKLGGMRY